MTRKGPLKVARTFIENKPEQFGVYAKRVPGGPFNGELLALCRDEKDAALFAAAPDLLEALSLCRERLKKYVGKTSYFPEDLEACQTANSAIAKATGATKP